MSEGEGAGEVRVTFKVFENGTATEPAPRAVFGKRTQPGAHRRVASPRPARTTCDGGRQALPAGATDVRATASCMHMYL